MGLVISVKSWPCYVFDRELMHIAQVEDCEMTLEERLKLLNEWPEDVSIGYSVIHTLRRLAYYIEKGVFYPAHKLDEFYRDALSSDLEKRTIIYSTLINFSDSEGWLLPLGEWDVCWNSSESVGSAVELWKELVKLRREILDTDDFGNVKEKHWGKNALPIIERILDVLEFGLKIGLPIRFW